jgi:response regulator RpfG family c-di-GMP phosphodiesterase
MAKRHTILVVDDEPDVVKSVQDLLRFDYRVLGATSAAEGLRIMQDNEVHCVMTDQRMPETTGVEFLTQLRGEHPTRSACCSPATPTSARSSRRSTRATSSATSPSPGTPKSCKPSSARAASGTT